MGRKKQTDMEKKIKELQELLSNNQEKMQEVQALYVLDKMIENKILEIKNTFLSQEKFANANILWTIARLLEIYEKSNRKTKTEKADLYNKLETFLFFYYNSKSFKKLDDFIALIKDLTERKWWFEQNKQRKGIKTTKWIS